jgi:hypothetical protein
VSVEQDVMDVLRENEGSTAAEVAWFLMKRYTSAADQLFAYNRANIRLIELRKKLRVFTSDDAHLPKRKCAITHKPARTWFTTASLQQAAP